VGLHASEVQFLHPAALSRSQIPSETVDSSHSGPADYPVGFAAMPANSSLPHYPRMQA
jgi:hypothetical protein